MYESLKNMFESLALTLAADPEPWALLMLFPLIGALILRRRQDD